MRDTRARTLACAFAPVAILLMVPARARAQQGAGVIVGVVRDAYTRTPVGDVVVTVTSNALQGEETVVTDSSGRYRLPNLGPGEYSVRFEHEDYRPLVRDGVVLRSDATLKIESLVMPEAIRGEQIVVVAAPPTVDIGSPSTGMNVTEELVRRVPLIEPGARGGAVRSFESAAVATPGVHSDDYGMSVAGATSPENQYVIDGLTVNSAQLGVNGAPLSIEFVKEVNVLSGGYLPEYGRSTGGVFDVVTKQGSNELRGAVWTHSAPAFLEGPRRALRTRGSIVETRPSLNHVADIGAEIGGPLVRDKLWFYLGLLYARTHYTAQRSLRANTLGPDGAPLLDETGSEIGATLPDTERRHTATGTDAQAFGKLTYAVSQQVRATLTAFYLPSWSGGDGAHAIDSLTGRPRFGFGGSRDDTAIEGSYGTLGRVHVARTFGATAKASFETASKRVRLDSTVGVQVQQDADRAADDTRVGATRGLASIPLVEWRRNSPGFHPITDFEPVPPGAPCEAAGSPSAVICPTQTYHSGGPGFLWETTRRRIQMRHVATFLFDALGSHVAKAGVEADVVQLDTARGYSGGHILRESDDGTAFDDSRATGVVTGPDSAVLTPLLRRETRSFTVGGFLQDSWSIVDTLTLTAGLRYDAQALFGGQNVLTMALPNQWSPRVGVLFDPTGTGHSKVFLHYARYYESVPLQIIDRTGSGEPNVYASRAASSCDPRDAAQLTGPCSAPDTRAVIGGPSSPDRRVAAITAGRTPIDPDLAPQSSDEIVAGFERDVVRRGRVGLVYTRRWMNRVIEDMSRDEAQTYFIGNPGYGAARDFPRAVRTYDALTAYLQKAFGETWIAQASYTLSYLRGNYAGLYRPETLQLDPNMNSDFDLRSLTVNRSGPLPADRTHAIKAYGAKDIPLGASLGMTLGAAFRATSGGPTSYLGSHPLYGANEVFILPRGEGERLPWVFNTDAHVGVDYELPGGHTLTLTIDVFNVLGSQEVTARDERYTSSDVSPLAGGTRGNLGSVQKLDGAPLATGELNPNFGQPVAYQEPRRFRLGLRATF